jgi:hypothetical protein
MAATRLGLYNSALRHLGERKLASLTEDRKPRRALDGAYDENLAHCLEQGLWNFAMRVQAIPASASTTPMFGFTYAFQKPDDWVRTLIISGSETLDGPDLELRDEQGFWFSNYDTLYVKFVSNDPAYGLDLSLWPQTFADYVAARLAWLICDPLNQDMNKQARLDKVVQVMKVDARAKDAMNEPPQFPPVGAWVRARTSGGGFGRGWRC